MSSRLARLLITGAGALLLALLLNLALAQPSASQPAPAAPNLTPTATPTATLTATPTVEPADWFSATASLAVSSANPTVGDSVTVTAQLVTTGTCGFSLYDVTLIQEEPLFTHVDPPSSVIGPPGENPAVWRLAAAQSDVTTFTVSFYGETYCNGVWQWTTVRSEPLAVTVNPLTIGLPFVSRNVPPVPVTDLGTLGGGHSIAYAINNQGQVAGYSRKAPLQDRAFLWQNGVMTDLDTLGGPVSVATDINERGQVAGYSTFGPMLSNYAFFWAGGVMTGIGTSGGASGLAVDVNLGGEVLVYSTVAYDEVRSLIWANGVITDLGTLGGNSTVASDINDRGQVVGYSKTGGGAIHAFLWQNGVMTDIHPVQATDSTATAINERGQVAGLYYGTDDARHGFLWDSGAVTVFGAPSAGINKIDAFNERGQVVGTYNNGIEPRAFLWIKDAASAGGGTPSRSHSAIDLGPLAYYGSTGCPTLLDDNGLVVLNSPNGGVLWRDGSSIPLGSLSRPGLTCAYAMNDRGQIVGSSIDANGEYHAVLWEAGE